MSNINADIGDIDCAWCGRNVPVRKNRNGKLYPACPNCGQQPLNAAGGQEIILERATIYGASKPVQVAKVAEPVKIHNVHNEKNELPEEPEQKPEEKRGSSEFSFLDA